MTTTKAQPTKAAKPAVKPDDDATKDVTDASTKDVTEKRSVEDIRAELEAAEEAERDAEAARQREQDERDAETPATVADIRRVEKRLDDALTALAPLIEYHRHR